MIWGWWVQCFAPVRRRKFRFCCWYCCCWVSCCCLRAKCSFTRTESDLKAIHFKCVRISLNCLSAAVDNLIYNKHTCAEQSLYSRRTLNGERPSHKYSITRYMTQTHTTCHTDALHSYANNTHTIYMYYINIKKIKINTTTNCNNKNTRSRHPTLYTTTPLDYTESFVRCCCSPNCIPKL